MQRHLSSSRPYRIRSFGLLGDILPALRAERVPRPKQGSRPYPMSEPFWVKSSVRLAATHCLTPLTDLEIGLMLRYDPDVLVGHDLIGDHMEIILQRLKELKIEHWSRIGRLRRSKNTTFGKQGTNVRLVIGRLVCDLTSDAAKVRPSPHFRFV